MFGNLIESSSHKGDYARKGSFFLGTLAVYGLAFLVIGVGSIYAYSTHVESPDLTLVTLVTPVDILEVRPSEPRLSRPSSGGPNNSRPVIVSSPPNSVRMDPYVTANTRVAKGGPELPVGTIFRIGNPGTGGNIFGPGTGTSTGGNGSSGGPNVDLGGDTGPPVMNVEKKTPVTTIKRSAGPINGQATFLPKPAYTPIAKAARAQGVISVQVLVDESGRVVSARALGGSPLLTGEAVRAAYLARFNPTTLGGVAVKVSGVITYNFVLT